MGRIPSLGLLAFIAVARCPPTEPSEGLRVRLNNGGTGLSVRVMVSGPAFTPRLIDLGIGAVHTTRLPGLAGDPIGFDVTVPRDQSITGSGSCTAGPDMATASTDIHGQVDLILEPSSTVIRVVCVRAGQPGGGWR